jgi:MFS transporter, FHS family, L-fucose permease
MALSTSTTTLSSSSQPGGNHTVALGALMVLFFMMGFITCLNDILIPYLKLVFQLNYTEVMLINTCFFGAYFVMSIPAGTVVQRIGYKRGMIVGFIIAAAGCLLFFPAADAKAYGLFLFALFILASGITMLQVAGNPYVSILGKPETASSRLTLTQAFNSLATTIAPIVGTQYILKSLPEVPKALRGVSNYQNLTAEQQAIYTDFVGTIQLGTLQYAYVGLAITLLIIAGVVVALKLPAIQAESTDTGAARSALSYRHLVLGAVAIFAYVGAEVTIGSFLVNYIKATIGIPEEQAGGYVSFYWGGAMVGRFLGSYLLARISPPKILLFNAIMAAALVLLTIAIGGETSIYLLLGVGFFNSLMFPTIFTLAVKGLGGATNQGSGILSTAIVGGAVIPLIMGIAVDAAGFGLGWLLPVVCYLYIASYGWVGHKPAATS